jgi:uncharacterized OsmC-like protein
MTIEQSHLPTTWWTRLDDGRIRRGGQRRGHDLGATQRQDLRGLEVVVSSTQDPDPPWTTRAIHTTFLLTGEVDVRKAEKVALADSKSCAVAATLRPVVELTHSVQVHPVIDAGV